ncbi:hypothetical protein GUITHDRAFT_113569 [Guillardia theta CCMP2712]|uniref:Uncharacterized protein n=1 Tax=Guillardia theta (strain CCMP2712) TaxID=905079 RepID=L1IVS9_GUITC|nr:hypothetical protein GUITHDRAFT_113569 [Guillardia theta CCMP2712]EKX40331.1 hypothetical protein GUITHDRAFT_113569 [Guillardia theta CCMP2712]|eukprot:XP_005827311.1 hypothetical protein GUITHDRAFT_113569 [Guillardia theta CCMP2712]
MQSSPPPTDPAMAMDPGPLSEAAEPAPPPPPSDPSGPAAPAMPSEQSGQTELVAKNLLPLPDFQDVPTSSPTSDSPPVPVESESLPEDKEAPIETQEPVTAAVAPTSLNSSESGHDNKPKVPPLPLHAPTRSATSHHPFQNLVPSPPPVPSDLGTASTLNPESALSQYLPSGNLEPGQDASSSKETRPLFSMFLEDSRSAERSQGIPQLYQPKAAQNAAYTQSTRLCQANFDYKGNRKCLQWQGPNDGEALLRTVARAYGVGLRSPSNPHGKLIYLTSRDTHEIIDVDTTFVHDNSDLIVHIEPEESENGFCGVGNDGGPFNVVPCIVRLFTCEYAAPSRRILAQKNSDESFVM